MIDYLLWGIALWTYKNLVTKANQDCFEHILCQKAISNSIRFHLPCFSSKVISLTQLCNMCEGLFLLVINNQFAWCTLPEHNHLLVFLHPIHQFLICTKSPFHNIFAFRHPKTFASNCPAGIRFWEIGNSCNNKVSKERIGQVNCPYFISNANNCQMIIFTVLT